MRQFLDLGMIIGADHDRVNHPAEHPRRIGNAFPAPDLRAARLHDDSAAPKLAHRHIE